MSYKFDVLISYSNKDLHVAQGLLSGLENNGIGCWIAPRNVQPGKTWGGSIMRSIRDTNVFLLILTDHSNKSNQVLNEVERAVSLHKPIVCYRVENIILSDDLELFLSATHWIEAFDKPDDETLQQLLKAVKPLISQNESNNNISEEYEISYEEREDFLRKAKKAYLSREFSLAHDYFLEASEAGSAEAMFYLGEMYRKGESSKRIATKAKLYYQKSIEQKSSLGYWGLARMLDEADELPERALKYYEQARDAIVEKAVEEDAYCCYLLSLMYSEGKGVQMDEKRAHRWLQKAFDNDYIPLNDLKSSSDSNNFFGSESIVDDKHKKLINQDTFVEHSTDAAKLVTIQANKKGETITSSLISDKSSSRKEDNLKKKIQLLTLIIFIFSILLSALIYRFVSDKSSHDNKELVLRDSINKLKSLKFTKVQVHGKKLFNALCSQCHAATDEILVGPGLLGVVQRTPSRDWLYRWIRNSSALVASGDEYANEIFNKSGKVQMSSFPNLTNKDIDDILSYIEHEETLNEQINLNN